MPQRSGARAQPHPAGPHARPGLSGNKGGSVQACGPPQFACIYPGGPGPAIRAQWSSPNTGLPRAHPGKTALPMRSGEPFARPKMGHTICILGMHCLTQADSESVSDIRVLHPSRLIKKAFAVSRQVIGVGLFMTCKWHVPAGAGVGRAACGAGRGRSWEVRVKSGVAHGRQQAPQCRAAGHAFSAGPAPGIGLPACEPPFICCATPHLHLLPYGYGSMQFLGSCKNS